MKDDDNFSVVINFEDENLKNIKKNKSIKNEVNIFCLLNLLNDDSKEYENFTEIFYSKIKSIETKQKLLLWNLSFFNMGIFIDVNENYNLEKPIKIKFDSKEHDKNLFPLIFINARKNSKFSIVKELNTKFASILNEFTALNQGENSDIKFYNIYNKLNKTIMFSSFNYNLEYKASTKQFDYIDEIFLSKMENRINLNGNKSSYKQDSVVVLQNENHISVKTHQHHRGKNSKSLVNYRSASLDSSYFVHNGLIEIENEAVDSDSYFKSKNLTISKKC